MPLYPDTRPIKAEQETVFDSPLRKALKTALRWSGLSQPQDQVLALMNPMETGPVGGLVGAVKERLAKRLTTPIKAYHGSPHDFDQFSLDKIGTGEGAQAYGHGLYFAENPGVAQSYRQKLSKFGPSSEMPEDLSKSVLFDGKVINGSTPSNKLTPRERAALAVHWDGNQQRAIQSIERDVLPYVTGEAKRLEEDTLSALRAEDFIGRVKPFDGRMYEVAIHASPDQLLDWDQPLSQQSPSVQQAIAKMREAGVAGDGFGLENPRATGGTLLRNGGVLAPEHNLKRFGVPGVKYLDGGSRAAGEGSRNYVIWDDSLIEIARKYGVALATAIGAMRQRATQTGSE